MKRLMQGIMLGALLALATVAPALADGPATQGGRTPSTYTTQRTAVEDEMIAANTTFYAGQIQLVNQTATQATFDSFHQVCTDTMLNFMAFEKLKKPAGNAGKRHTALRTAVITQRDAYCIFSQGLTDEDREMLQLAKDTNATFIDLLLAYANKYGLVLPI